MQQFKNVLFYRVLVAWLKYFWLLYLSLRDIKSNLEIESGQVRRDRESNFQS